MIHATIKQIEKYNPPKFAVQNLISYLGSGCNLNKIAYDAILQSQGVEFTIEYCTHVKKHIVVFYEFGFWCIQQVTHLISKKLRFRYEFLNVANLKSYNHKEIMTYYKIFEKNNNETRLMDFDDELRIASKDDAVYAIDPEDTAYYAINAFLGGHNSKGEHFGMFLVHVAYYAAVALAQDQPEYLCKVTYEDARYNQKAEFLRLLWRDKELTEEEKKFYQKKQR